MAQATKHVAEAGPRAAAARQGDDVVASIIGILTQLKRRSGDPEASASAFLLGHVERMAPVRATDLAEHVGLDLSTISRHLRGLEDSGMLVRSPDPDDRRASLLTVTDEGRAYVDRATRARTALVTRATETWTDTDRTTLGRLLARLADDLENL